jgi:hypothetical protein
VAETTFTTFKTPDGELIDALHRIQGECFPNEQNVQFTLVASDRSHPLSGAWSKLREDETVQLILASGSAVCSQVTMALPARSVAVQIQRQEAADRVRVSFQDNAEAALVVPLLIATRRHLRAYERTEAIDRLLGAELTEFYRKREQTALHLENLLHRLTEEAAAYRRQVDQEEGRRDPPRAN